MSWTSCSRHLLAGREPLAGFECLHRTWLTPDFSIGFQPVSTSVVDALDRQDAYAILLTPSAYVFCQGSHVAVAQSSIGFQPVFAATTNAPDR